MTDLSDFGDSLSFPLAARSVTVQDGLHQQLLDGSSYTLVQKCPIPQSDYSVIISSNF